MILLSLSVILDSEKKKKNSEWLSLCDVPDELSGHPLLGFALSELFQHRSTARLLWRCRLRGRAPAASAAYGEVSYSLSEKQQLLFWSLVCHIIFNRALWAIKLRGMIKRADGRTGSV